ncbi:N-acetylglucosamine-6-phosphate deacetylase [Micrococcus endophyticus]|uniref:N-acetylglucosamine-6-phosphate deacetylase n=1 Tax=Micrococcus endophyticus TaxID=455343 RepID=UPI0020052D45|nr:N-acetylglucosamine-6-phosphate deacetylase [Micrococcus endophyticus]MCK6090497.1 N-acetylglucosamine-6-phosphate deacetylase [Micrococcus endophyticus]
MPSPASSEPLLRAATGPSVPAEPGGDPQDLTVVWEEPAAGRAPDDAAPVRLRWAGPAAEAPRGLLGRVRPGGHARARRITPPLADHHVHGGAGVDLATSGADDVRRWLAELRAAGASVVLGSLPALAPADLAPALERLRPLWEDGALAGVHLEGPFLSPARAGAQHPAALCAPDSAAGRRVRELLRAQPRGFVRTLTLAPELPCAREVAAELEAAGTVLCLGHTDAGPAEVAAALDWPRAGTSATPVATPVATHLFNGMRPFHHRDPGPVPTLLAAARRGRLRLELVADGAHVAPELMALILEDPDLAAQTCLVSDAIAATGAPCGTVHRLGPAVVHAAPDAPRLGEPAEDGRGSEAAGPADGGRAPLAGGRRTLVEAVTALLAAGLDADAVLRAAVHVPRRSLAETPAPELEDGALVWGEGRPLVALPAARA